MPDATIFKSCMIGKMDIEALKRLKHKTEADGSNGYVATIRDLEGSSHLYLKALSEQFKFPR